MVGAEVDMPKRKDRNFPKVVGMRFQKSLQLFIAGIVLLMKVLGQKLHFLSKPAANDRVILFQAKLQGFAVVDFLANVVVDDVLDFIRLRRALPDSGPTIHENPDLGTGHNDLVTRLLRAAVLPRKQDKQHCPAQQKMNQRFFEDSSHEPGEYQIGDV